MSDELRIATLGGVPQVMGGGGMEVQLERTTAALRSRGHQVVAVERAPAETSWDILHAFGSEPGTWHALQNWRRCRTPLVVTPVMVVSPGRQELIVRLSLRAPKVLYSAERMRREILEAADAVVAGNAYERRLIERFFGVSPRRVVEIGNGWSPSPQLRPPSPNHNLLMVGVVSARKRQAEVVEAVGGRWPVIVAGGFLGSAGELERWKELVRKHDVDWQGEIGDPIAIRKLEREAGVLVHMSSAEVQSLAVVETLAEGTPAVLSDIPSHRELCERWPEWVKIAGSFREVPEAVHSLLTSPPQGPRPNPPSWDDVACSLVNTYRSVLGM